MAESSLSVPVAQIARIFHLTERRVQQLASDGIIPKAERGRYHFIESVQGYIKFLQERAFGKSDNTTDSHHERTRLLRAKADLTEMEHKEKQGELIRADVVYRNQYKAGTILKNNLLSIPDRQSAILASETDAAKVHAALTEEINNCLADALDAMKSEDWDSASLDITVRDARLHLDESSGGE